MRMRPAAAGPSTTQQVVDELLAHLGASGDEQAPVPSWHYQEDPSAPNPPTASLRHLLGACYDLKTPKAQPLLALLLAQLQAVAAGSPGRPSFELHVDATAAGAAADGAGGGGGAAAAEGGSGKAAKQAGAAAGVARLQALLADAAGLEGYLAPRHVADVLADFAGARLTAQQVRGGTGTGAAGMICLQARACVAHLVLLLGARARCSRRARPHAAARSCWACCARWRRGSTPSPRLPWSTLLAAQASRRPSPSCAMRAWARTGLAWRPRR